MEAIDAGWSSLVARRAHNPEVAGSNPAPATMYQNTAGALQALVCVAHKCGVRYMAQPFDLLCE